MCACSFLRKGNQHDGEGWLLLANVCSIHRSMLCSLPPYMELASSCACSPTQETKIQSSTPDLIPVCTLTTKHKQTSTTHCQAQTILSSVSPSYQPCQLWRFYDSFRTYRSAWLDAEKKSFLAMRPTLPSPPSLFTIESLLTPSFRPSYHHPSSPLLVPHQFISPHYEWFSGKLLSFVMSIILLIEGYYVILRVLSKCDKFI